MLNYGKPFVKSETGLFCFTLRLCNLAVSDNLYLKPNQLYPKGVLLIQIIAFDIQRISNKQKIVK